MTDTAFELGAKVHEALRGGGWRFFQSTLQLANACLESGSPTGIAMCVRLTQKSELPFNVTALWKILCKDLIGGDGWPRIPSFELPQNLMQSCWIGREVESSPWFL